MAKIAPNINFLKIISRVSSTESPCWIWDQRDGNCRLKRLELFAETFENMSWLKIGFFVCPDHTFWAVTPKQWTLSIVSYHLQPEGTICGWSDYFFAKMWPKKSDLMDFLVQRQVKQAINIF